MKRRDLIAELDRIGCVLLRNGSRRHVNYVVRPQVLHMRRTILILVGLAILIGLGVYLLVPGTQRIYALASRTAEFTFVIRDSETKEPIPGATIKIWDDPFQPAQRKQLAELTTDANGSAKYVREDQSVEDVIGISASHKLGGVRKHPAGVGTFVDRYWCTLDIRAKGFIPLQYEGLGSYDYDDNGYDESAKMHRFEFIIEMRRAGIRCQDPFKNNL